MDLKRYSIILILIILFLPIKLYGKTVFSLRDAIIFALKNNPELNLYKLKVKEAELSKKQAFSQFLPSLSITYNYQRSDQGKGLPTTNFSSIGPELSWNIFNGLQDWYNYKELSMLLKAQKQEEKNKTIELAFQIVQAYLDYLKQKAFYQSALKSLEDAQTILSLVKQKYKQGLCSYADLLDAEAKVKKAKFEVTKYLYTAEIAKAELLTLLNLDISKISDVEFLPLDTKNLKVQPLSTCVQVALKNNPQLKEVNYTIYAQQARVNSVKGEFLPSIDLYLQYYKTSPTFSLIPEKDEEFTAGVRITIPIFWGGKRFFELEKQETILEEKKLQKRSLKLSVVKEVFSSYKSLESAKQKYLASQEWLRKIKEDYEVVKEKYEQGIASIVDLTTVFARLASARAELISAKYNLIEKYYELQKTMGIIPGLKP
ncbi:MAG: TolC family protein [Thermodesulfobacteria bacterium]|nr:TolC family protein [Thermodesulfobacteriota bacterium]